MDLPPPRTLREKQGYLGLDFHGLPNKEARHFVKHKIIRMNKKFCHLDSQQIKNSATLLQYINTFFNDLLRLLWQDPDRRIDGSDRQMFVDIMRMKIIHFTTNYPNLAERIRKVKGRASASRAISETLSDSDDDDNTDEEEQASFRATDTACKLPVLVFTIASEKLATVNDRVITQEPSGPPSPTSDNFVPQIATVARDQPGHDSASLGKRRRNKKRNERRSKYKVDDDDDDAALHTVGFIPGIQTQSSSSPQPERDLLQDFLPHTKPSLPAETVNTAAVGSIAYEPAFAPLDRSAAAVANRPPHQIPTPSVEAHSVKSEPGQETASVLPRLRLNKEAATRADPEDIFVEIWIASDNSNHSIHTLDTCMTMPDLFTKVTTELQIYSIERMSAEFKDDNVVRFWKCVLEKNGSQAKWKKMVQLACERQTDIVDGTIVVTVDSRDFTRLVAIED